MQRVIICLLILCVGCITQSGVNSNESIVSKSDAKLSCDHLKVSEYEKWLARFIQKCDDSSGINQQQALHNVSKVLVDSNANKKLSQIKTILPGTEMQMYLVPQAEYGMIFIRQIHEVKYLDSTLQRKGYPVSPSAQKSWTIRVEKCREEMRDILSKLHVSIGLTEGFIESTIQKSRIQVKGCFFDIYPTETLESNTKAIEFAQDCIAIFCASPTKYSQVIKRMRDYLHEKKVTKIKESSRKKVEKLFIQYLDRIVSEDRELVVMRNVLKHSRKKIFFVVFGANHCFLDEILAHNKQSRHKISLVIITPVEVKEN